MNTRVATFRNVADAVEGRATRTSRGISVTLYCMEADETLPVARIWPEDRIQEAINYARKIAGPEAVEVEPDEPHVTS